MAMMTLPIASGCLASAPTSVHAQSVHFFFD
jgi:hypothetical protein